MPALLQPAGTTGSTAKSKTLATWIALLAGLAGTLGLHRFYLKGWRDPWGWLHVPSTLLGGLGVQRMQQFGQDDRLAWLLIPLLGLSLSVAMLSAIAAVIGVVLALLVGATVLMSTIAFSVQRLVELQLEARDHPP
jgi:hypothetical protein